VLLKGYVQWLSIVLIKITRMILASRVRVVMSRELATIKWDEQASEYALSGKRVKNEQANSAGKWH
jgi:hypothetical protein